MSAFSFFQKKEAAPVTPAAEASPGRLERTTTRITDSLQAMTFSPESGLLGLKVRTLASTELNEIGLEVIGLVPNNEIGLGPDHLELIAEQLNRELAEDDRPFQVVVAKFWTTPVSFGEDAPTEASSYILKVQEIPSTTTEPGSNVIPFDRH